MSKYFQVPGQEPVWPGIILNQQGIHTIKTLDWWEVMPQGTRDIEWFVTNLC